jgi:hypothetical protein
MLKAYGILQENPEFKKWKQLHNKSYLSHIFSSGQEEYMIGFADTSGERITTFTVRQNSVTMSGAEEAFKKPETKILPLALTKVSVSLDDALKKAIHMQQEKYKGHSIIKKIVILQHLPVGQVYNITFVTNTFHTLNIKIDAANARVHEHKLTSLFDFARKNG